MTYLTGFWAVSLLAGILALSFAGDTVVTLFGKLAVAVSLLAFVATAVTDVMVQSFAAHALRNEDFHWY